MYSKKWLSVFTLSCQNYSINQQKQVLHDVKDILLDVVPDITLNDKSPILDQLVQVVDKINEPEIDTQSKFMQRAENKSKHKVLEKVSTELTIQQVALSTYVTDLEVIVQNVITLFHRLCNIPSLTRHVKDKL